MPVVPGQFWLNPLNAPALRRSAILVLVGALHALLLLMLLRLAPPPAPTHAAPPAPIAFELIPAVRPDPVRAPAAKARRAATPLTAPKPPEAPQAPSSSAIWSQVVPITREQFADADVAKMPSHLMAHDGDGAGKSGTTPGQDSDDALGTGGGPNGERLYNAQWYRHPTRAELDFYLPTGSAPTGWGMIACQTVPDYRVENCHEIAQSPAGSGLARAVRQAAWQFRVLPPRIGGRPVVGAWVRIRIDYTVNGPA